MIVLAAHGTRDPAGARVFDEVADRLRVRGFGVRVCYADVHAPDVTSVLRALDGEPVVVIPAFLAAGYHVRSDIPRQVMASGHRAVTVARPFGPAPELVEAVRDRLAAAGWRPGDSVVLAAAGSSDPRALADVRYAADALAARLGTPVRIGYAATACPSIVDAVAAAPGRVAVASWLLAPGLFHRKVAASGAEVVADPVGAHSRVVDLVVRRYAEAAPMDTPSRFLQKMRGKVSGVCGG